MSWVGNGLGYRLLIFIWAVSGALVFRAMIRALAKELNVKLSGKSGLSFCSWCSRWPFPHLPDSFPFLAQLHILVSNLAFIGLNVLILYVFVVGKQYRWQIGAWGIEMTAAILILCALLYVSFFSA